jgi:hypothetical protein
MLVWMGLYWEGGICEYGLDREMIVNPRTEATDWNSLFQGALTGASVLPGLRGCREKKGALTQCLQTSVTVFRCSLPEPQGL